MWAAALCDTGNTNKMQNKVRNMVRNKESNWLYLMAYGVIRGGKRV